MFTLAFLTSPTSTDWWLDSFTAVLALLTGVLAFVGYLQYRAMRTHERLMGQNVELAKSTVAAARISAKAAAATVIQMRRTAQRELRARVFVEHAERFGMLSASSYSVAVTIKNFGKVPAYKCTYKIEVVFRSSIPDASAFPPLVWQGRETTMVLPPNGTVHALLSMPTGTFSLTQHNQALNGVFGVYVYGEIRYRDGFGKNRFSKFRLISSGLEYNHSRFSFCDQGNETG
jgi:hypothetical protein